MTPGLSPSEVSAKLDATARFFSKLGTGLLVIFAVFAAITVVILALGGVADARWIVTVLVVSGAFGPALTVAGVGLRRRRESGRRLTVAIVWVGIPLLALLTGALEIYSSGEGDGHMGRMGFSIGWVICLAAFVLTGLELGVRLFFPAKAIPPMLRFFNSDEVRAQFRSDAPHGRSAP